MFELVESLDLLGIGMNSSKEWGDQRLPGMEQLGEASRVQIGERSLEKSISSSWILLTDGETRIVAESNEK